ncbi:hypothetical protein H4Q26_010792 [Puccinia striiformis f. sp. tritici PST-130]|nr:hypothetical protein H4Q26_010792 [Puccinia striiformis f. sp. tritici PST-130]
MLLEAEFFGLGDEANPTTALLRRKPLSVGFNQRKYLHISPPTSSLPFSIEKGLDPFLSAKTVKSLAIDWQDGLLDRLNQHVKGTSAEHKSLFDTIIDLARIALK